MPRRSQTMVSKLGCRNSTLCVLPWTGFGALGLCWRAHPIKPCCAQGGLLYGNPSLVEYFGFADPSGDILKAHMACGPRVCSARDVARTWLVQIKAGVAFAAVESGLVESSQSGVFHGQQFLCLCMPGVGTLDNRCLGSLVWGGCNADMKVLALTRVGLSAQAWLSRWTTHLDVDRNAPLLPFLLSKRKEVCGITCPRISRVRQQPSSRKRQSETTMRLRHGGLTRPFRANTNQEAAH